ncbi:MAG: hypothetical protein ABIR46_00810 [Candidatus Saccharimonadales bacterium]
MFHRKRLPKPKKGAWFIPIHWSYLPASWQGWLTYIPFIVFLIGTFMIVDRNTQDLWALGFILFPYWICGVVVMHWIAGHKG